MTTADFRTGEELITRGEHSKAFHFFEGIAADAGNESRLRADAFTWMGTWFESFHLWATETNAAFPFTVKPSSWTRTTWGRALGLSKHLARRFPTTRTQMLSAQP